MTHREQVEAAFPELEQIEDDDLRESVVETWTIAMAENDVESLADWPWLPSRQSKLGLEDETLVAHVRDVTAATVALAEALLERRDVDISMDRILAAALLHDVSQLAEFDGWDATPVYDLIGHPYWATYPMERAGVPVDVQHAVLAHTTMSNVEPATLDALILKRADFAVAMSIQWQVTEDLRDR
jgi:hypothetical protein